MYELCEKNILVTSWYSRIDQITGKVKPINFNSTDEGEEKLIIGIIIDTGDSNTLTKHVPATTSNPAVSNPLKMYEEPNPFTDTWLIKGC